MEVVIEKTFSSLQFQSLVLRYFWFRQTNFQFSLLLKKEYFDDPRCESIFSWIIYFVKTHGPPATKLMMREVLSKANAVPKSLDLFNLIIKKDLSSSEVSYVESRVREFCRFQSVLDILANKAAPLMESGDLTELQRLLDKSFSIGQKEFGQGLDYFDRGEVQRRIKDRLLGRTKNHFSTWIAELDQYLSFRRGQIAILLGNSGRGKTMSLLYFSKVFMMQALKVVYYTLQIPEDEIATRLDSALSNIKMSDLKDQASKIVRGINKFKTSFNSQIIIKGFPSRFLTVDILRSHLDLLRSKGFNPDCVVIDYGNLMTEEGRKRRDGSRYEELGNVYTGLMALSQEQNIFTLIAHQTKASSWNNPLITISDANESSEVVMVSPLVLSMNRNLDDEKNDQARIFIAKNSYGPDGIVVTINTDFPKGQFFVPYRKDSSLSASSQLSGSQPPKNKKRGKVKFK